MYWDREVKLTVFIAWRSVQVLEGLADGPKYLKDLTPMP